MTTHLKIAIVALALAVSVPAFGQDHSTSSVIGAWRMTSLQSTNSNGSLVTVPYSGQVIFAKGGTLSVQAMNPDPAAEPTTYTVNGYEAYYGPVKIDEKKNASPLPSSRRWCAISLARRWSENLRSLEIGL